jgi:PST family polysaccharide transporter
MNRTWTSILPAFIRVRLEGRQGLQAIVNNTGWLFADKLVRMGVGLFVNIWVARYLGPDRFGLLNYAIAYIALFTAIATLGLDGVVVRELVRTPSSGREILGSAFALRMAGAFAMLTTVLATASLVRHGNGETLLLIAIIAAGPIFQALDVVDFWFQSRVLSKYSVIARNSAFLVVASFKIYLILSGAPLVAFAWAALLEVVLASVGLAAAYWHYGERFHAWRFSLKRCRDLLTDSWPLILSGFSIAVFMKIDQVMLGNMAGNQAVGIYSCAVRLSETWNLIPMSIVSSVFPAVIQAKSRDEGLYYRRIQRLFSFMVLLSLSIAIPMTFLSTRLIILLFGAKFAAAGPVLSIHIWASLFVFFAIAQYPWDLAENLMKLSLFRISMGALLNVGLNFWLIPAHGALGAAVATVVSQAFAALFLNLVSGKTRPIFFCQVRSLLFFRYLREIW